MPDEPKILAFAGSARAESWNQKLVPAAVAGGEQRGAEVTTIDLRDFPMPIFDEDFEAAEGTPEHARRFKRLLMEHDGFLIACPESNSSNTPLLKNVIDWASGPDKDSAGPVFGCRGRCAAVVAAMMSPPLLLFTVTTWPTIPTLTVAAMFVEPDSVAPLTLKPAGNVISTLPPVGTAPTVVKSTVTLPVAPATRDAGVTDVPVRAAASTFGTANVSSTTAAATSAAKTCQKRIRRSGSTI